MCHAVVNYRGEISLCSGTSLLKHNFNNVKKRLKVTLKLEKHFFGDNS